MNAEVTTILGQLSIVDGEWRAGAANQVAVRQPKAVEAPGAGKGDLFIITEIQGNVKNISALEEKLAAAIRDSYYLARGSVTASLRRAVQTGSDLLYQRNRQVEVEKRVVGGVVALVMSEEDAFVAQIGPTAFFAVLGDHIQRYPHRSVWLDESLGKNSEETPTGLGLTPVVEPGLHHLRVTPEDMLVLADSRLAGRLLLKDVVQAVANSDVKQAVKNLGEVANSQQGTALVLKVIEKAAVAAEGPVKISAASSLSNLWPGRRSDTEPVPAGATESEAEETVAGALFANTATLVQKPLSWLGNITHRPQPTPAVDDSPPAPQPAPSPTPAAGPGTAIKPDTSPPTSSPTNEATPTEQEEFQDERLLPQDDGPISRPLTSAQAARIDDTLADAPVAGDQATAKSNSPLSWLTTALLAVVATISGGLRNVLGLVSGNSEDDLPRQAGAQAQEPTSRFSWKMLRNIAIAIPILVAIIVGVSYLQKGRLQEAEYQEYVTTAQSKFVQAQSVDAPSALALIAEAEQSLLQAETIKTDQPEIATLREEMAGYIDTVGNVQRLYYLPQQRRYTDPGTEMKRIVVQGVEVYTMDAGNDRVFHHRLDDMGEALVPDDETVLMIAKGQAVDEITVSEMLGMTWMPTGGNRQTSDLVILNSAGLLEYNPNWGITSAALGATEQLVGPVAVDSYFGNFYVLDPQAGVLLRYLPTTEGYSGPPQNYFAADEPATLSQAVDMAIDGAVYILFADGRINKYLSGAQTDFTISGLDVPLSNPTAIFTAPDEEVQHLYVADTGNQRVVQLNKDGSFVRQFKPSLGEAVTFGNLQDIYVDEIGSRLFVLDSNNLYLGKLPVE